MPITFVRYLGRTLQDTDLTEYHAAIFRRTRALGWRNVLVCAPPVPRDAQLLAPLEALGVELAYLPRPRNNFDFEVVRAAYRLCRAVHADVVHCDNIHTSPLIGAWLARVPVRLWFKRAMLRHYEEMRTLRWYERLLPSVRTSCALATKVVCVSEAVCDELVALGMAREKFEVLLNPVPSRPIAAAERAAARKHFGLNERDFVIVSVGHAVAVKGWDVLVEAFARTRALLPATTQLFFVGSTSASHERAHFESLQQRVASFGLTEAVRFTGRLDPVRPALAAADLYVQPSYSEGNCNALNEAYGAGLPCIATAVGFAPKLIRHGENGWLVPRGEPDALAAALALLGGNAALRTQLAERACSLLPEGSPSDWEDYYDRLVELYRRHAERGSLLSARGEVCP